MKVTLSIVHIVLCVILVSSVILQPRKQGRFGGIFGGTTQADVSATRQWHRFSTLSRVTVVCCTFFMATSLALILM